MKFRENAEDLAKLNPDLMGFIFYERSKRAVQSGELNFIRNLPVDRVGVFVNEEPSVMRETAEAVALNHVQLHGDESPAICEKMQQSELKVIKSFGLSNNFKWDTLKDYVGLVDYFLFDTADPGRGGTGKTFDWTLLRQYELELPYFLSGGLSRENIEEALRFDDQRLYALDLNSRFETAPGLKDVGLLQEVFTIIRNNNESISG